MRGVIGAGRGAWLVTCGVLWQCRSSNTTEHFAKESWQPWHEEAFQRDDVKACLPDELGNRPIQVTATSETALQGVAAILPPRHAGAITAAMFKKDIPASGFQHPTHFLQGPDDIGNGAQSPGGHHTVKAGVGKWQSDRRNVEARDRYMGRRQTLRYPLGQDSIGINCGQ